MLAFPAGNSVRRRMWTFLLRDPLIDVNMQRAKTICAVLPQKSQVTKQATIFRWKNILRQCVLAPVPPHAI